MIKKSIGFLFILLILILVVPGQVFATAPVDQMCGSVGGNILPDIGRQKVYQTFVPTKNTIDAVGAFLSPHEDHRVKIRVQIYNMSSIWHYRLVVDHLSSIDNVIGYHIIDLPDTYLDPGYYALSFQTVHASDSVKWVGTHHECYPNGNAIIDDENLPNANMTFTTYAYDAPIESSEPSDQSDSVADTSTDDSSSADTSTDDSSSSTDQPNKSLGTPNISTSTTGSSDAISAEAPDSSVQGVNNSNDQVKPMPAEEMAAFLAWIKEDHEANSSHGIFGLGGVLGSILTWPVVIGCGVFFFLLLTIIIIIVLVARKRPRLPVDQQPTK